MAASGAWTEIEAAAPQPRSARGAPANPADGGGAEGGGVEDGRAVAGAGRRARLRRQARPIVGSIDAGGVALQRNAGAAVLGAAVFLVPAMALNLVVSRAAFDRFQSLDETVVSVPQVLTGVQSATGVETLLAYLSLATTSLAVALAGAHLTLLVVRRSLGLPVSPRACLRIVARKLPALVLAWAIAHAWILLADLAAVHLSVQDLAPMATLLVPMLAFLVGFTILVVPVMMTEHLGPLRSVRRAVRLARSRLGVVFGFSAACVLIGGGVRAAISGLPWLIEQTGLFSFGRFGWLAGGIAAQLAQLVAVPLIGLSTAVVYLQIRMDAEGLDLVLEAERAFS